MGFQVTHAVAHCHYLRPFPSTYVMARIKILIYSNLFVLMNGHVTDQISSPWWVIIITSIFYCMGLAAHTASFAFTICIRLMLPEQVLPLLFKWNPLLQLQWWLPNRFLQLCWQFPLLLTHSFMSIKKNKTQQRERNYCKTKGLEFTSSCRRNKVLSLFSSTIITIRK